ncbi:MAG: FixH family protein [Acidobacteria bacterium]|nr:FixH family protein [Acidobacteriota bacterium]
MIAAIIEHVIRLRWLVVAAVTILVVLSVYALRTASLDAIPDISDPQVIVYVKWPRSPLLIETEVTEPVIRALAGSPDIRAIRGTSHMGYSFIYVVLEDPGRRAAVREYVTDRLTAIRAELPPDAAVTLGPNASSMGWIFQYALVDRQKTHDLRELRLLNESLVKPALQSAPGVAEVASVGGLEKQYQVKLFPPLLRERGLSLPEVLGAIQTAFQEAGGRTIEVTNREYQLRGGIGADSIGRLDFLVLGRDGTGRPVALKDVGYVQVGYDLRRGIADLDGAGEVVGGIAIMEQGRNVLAVTASLLQRLDALAPALPDGVEIVPTYNRSSLIWDTLRNFFQAIAYELLVVIVVIAVALRNLRAAVAPVCVLLLGTLFTALPLAAFGQTINLFSLAGLAIAIGEMADATIVIVENCTAQLARQGHLDAAERLRTIIRSTAAMTRPLLFSMLIIVTSFLPIFFLGEREGRLFNPLAFGKTAAMAFSTLLTLFALPVVIVWIFKKDVWGSASDREHPLVGAYRRALGAAIRARYAFVAASAVILAVALVVMTGFEKDYMPEMEEGAILYMPTTLPGLPSREAGWILQEMDRKLKAFPEVERVFGKLGRADSATDPAPVEMIETTVMLKPRSEWRPGMTKDRLVAEMNQAMAIVGYVNSWSQPIATRVVMQDTGIQTPVGIKVKGRDLEAVQQLAQEVERLLRDVPGTQSVIAERIARGYFVDARLDLERMAQHGVTVDEALPTVRFAIGGDNVIGIREPDKTVVPLAVQYSPEYIDTLEKVRATPVVTGDGRAVALSAIADVSVRAAPEMIRNDNGELAGYIYVFPRDVTAPEYVDRARAHLQANLSLPSGYSLEWTGVYQYAEEARAQLQVVVPMTLVIMFVLLLLAFRSLADGALIMLSAPFALVGGVFLQWQQGFSMTTAVIIGYVSLFAVAIQTGIIMIEFIREALAHRTPSQSYMDAVIEGSVARLRPKLMTVATTVFGLLPIMFSTGSGMDITQPIATPTLGGMISSTVYVLFLIPCLFAIGHDIRVRRAAVIRHRHPVTVPVVLLAIALACGACGRETGAPGDGGREAPTGVPTTVSTDRGMNVEFRSAPDPPQAGDNTYEVTVTQTDGTPVTDAHVTAVFSMPPMPAMNMPAMRSDASLTHVGNGTYRGTGQLSMGGTWNVEVSIARGSGPPDTARLSLVAK